MALTKVDDRGLKTPIDLQDNEQIRLGTGNDLQIWHDSSNTNLKNDTGDLYIRSSGVRITNGGVTEHMAKFFENGAVELYYDNSKKFETTSGGSQATGLLRANNLMIDGSSGYLSVPDGRKAYFGTGDDLEIYHDGSNSYLKENGTGGLYQQTNGNGIFLQKTDGETMANFVSDGAVELYHDNTKRFETCSLGVRFFGNIYADDNEKVLLGNSQDLQFYHDGTNSIIKNTHEDLYIDCQSDDLILKAADNIFIQPDSGDNGININGNGAVEIYHDNSKKFETRSGGLGVFGHIEAGDNNKLMLGDSNDLQIYHDGSASILENSTGNLAIRGKTGENHIVMIPDSKTALYFDNSLKFETQSGGAKVTGTLSVTGAIYTDNEFNMTAVGNKFIDTAHKDNTLHFRRINDGDGGHSTHCTVSSGGEWSANFNDTSDEKLKENITAISDGAINKVKQLRPVNFDWKETDKANNVSGFIAQEIKTVLPNLVYGTEYDPTIVDEQTQCIKSTGYSVNTIGIVAHLTKALQEAITKIEVLETKVAALEAK